MKIPPGEESIRLILPLAPDLRFPGPLVSLDKVNFAFAPNQEPILRDINLSIHMGSRVGCGKSTLIKLVIDSLMSTKGTMTRHPRPKLGYYSQFTMEELRMVGSTDPS